MADKKSQEFLEELIKAKDVNMTVKFADHIIFDLENTEFFRNCGKQTTNNNWGAVVLTEKTLAEKSIISDEWSDYTQERLGDITSHLFDIAQKEYDKNWNDFVKQFDSSWNNRILPKVLIGINNNGFDEIILPTIKWDLMSYVMLESFSKYKPPGFYKRIGHIYIDGNLPCGIIHSTTIDADKIIVY